MSIIGDIVYFYFAEVNDTRYRGPFPAILLYQNDEGLAILHVLLTDGRTLYVPNCPRETDVAKRLEQGLEQSIEYSPIRKRCFWGKRPT